MKKIEKVGEELELKLTMLKSDAPSDPWILDDEILGPLKKEKVEIKIQRFFDDEGQAGLIFSGPFPSCKDGKMVIYI